MDAGVFSVQQGKKLNGKAVALKAGVYPEVEYYRLVKNEKKFRGRIK